MPKRITRQEPKPNPKRVRFSFKHLQTGHARFPISSCTKEYYEALFCEMIRYESFMMDDFKSYPNDDHRHFIDFSKTAEEGGFTDIDPSDEELWTEEPWSFCLPGEKYTPSWSWRVHGFISDNVFHVVWLDPEHRLDSYKENHESTIPRAE